MYSVTDDGTANVSACFVAVEDGGASLRYVAENIVTHIFNTKVAQKPDTPLIVIMGEDHTKPITQLLQYAVLYLCLEKGLRPAFGLELRYDFLNSPHVLPDSYTKNAEIAALLSNPTTHRNLIDIDLARSYLNKDILDSSLSLCDKHKLSFKFNDASRAINSEGKNLINTQDDLFMNTAKRLRYKAISSPLEIDAPKAIHIRNQIMCDFAFAQYQQDQPDVLIHMVGDSHVLGNEDYEYQYRHSMTHLCRQKGFDVIPVATSFDEDEIPFDAPLQNAIIIDGWQDAPSFNNYVTEEYVQYMRTLFETSRLPLFQPLGSHEKSQAVQRYLRRIRKLAIK